MAKKLNNEELLEKVAEYRRHGEDVSKGLFERMRKGRRFKIGDQWDEDVKRYYKSKRKHALTINRILPIILQLCGVEIENRKDIKARPVKGGTATAATIISSLVKHAMDQSFADFQKSQMFENGTSCGVGYLYVDKDYSDDPKNGNLKIKRLNPFRVLADRTEDYDLNISGKYIMFDEWYDKEKLKLEYPKAAPDLGDVSYSNSDQKSAWGSIIRYFFPAKTEGYDSVDGEGLNEERMYKFRLTHTFWKQYRKCVYLYRVDEDSLAPKKITDESQMKYARELAKNYPQLASVYETTDVLLHHTKTCGDVFLEDIENPFPNVDDPTQGVTMFPIVPFYPYFVDGYAFGVVENLIGPQEEHNWCRSQTLNIIKKLANTGWIVKKLMGSYGEFLRDHGSEDGIVLEESKGGGSIKKIEETKLPDAHEFVAQRSAQDIAEIANVRIEKPEFDDKNMSGRAIALKMQSSMTGSATMFANYDYSIRIFATLLMEIIRNCGVYSEDEIRAIMDESDLINADMIQKATEALAQEGIEMPEAPGDVMSVLQQAQVDPSALSSLTGTIQAEMELYERAQQQFQQLAQQKAQEILFAELKSIATGKYGIKVDASDNSPTMRMAHFMELKDLHKILVESNQPGIAREDLIMASDIKNKEDIARSGVQVPQAA
jgi:hypothetical protein